MPSSNEGDMIKQAAAESPITMPASLPEGKQDLEQQHQSFSLHGSRRDSHMSRRMAVASASTPLVANEENEHSIS